MTDAGIPRTTPTTVGQLTPEDTARAVAAQEDRLAGLRVIRTLFRIMLPVYFVMIQMTRDEGWVSNGSIGPEFGAILLLVAPAIVVTLAAWLVLRVRQDAGSDLRRRLHSAAALDMSVAIMFALLAFAAATTVVAALLGLTSANGLIDSYHAYAIGLVALIAAGALLFLKAKRAL